MFPMLTMIKEGSLKIYTILGLIHNYYDIFHNFQSIFLLLQFCPSINLLLHFNSRRNFYLWRLCDTMWQQRLIWLLFSDITPLLFTNAVDSLILILLNYNYRQHNDYFLSIKFPTGILNMHLSYKCILLIINMCNSKLGIFIIQDFAKI